jgi:hypothetical protein
MRESIDIYNHIDPSDVKKKYLELILTLGIWDFIALLNF